MERSLSSCSVLEVIGSHRPQYFKLVMLGKRITRTDQRGLLGFPFAVWRILPVQKSPNIISSTLHRNHRHHKPQNIGIKLLYLHLVD